MTKEELENQNRELQQRIEDLELALSDRDIGAMKTKFMMRAYAIFLAIITLIQSAFAGLGKPSPFTGAFAWILVAMAVLVLVGYITELAMHRERNLDIKAKVGAQGTELSASVGTKKSKGA